MKTFKYLAFAVVVVLLATFLYRNVIYYQLSFNPIKEYAAESKIEFHMTENLPDGKGIHASCHDTEACGLVLKYLSNLELKPITDNTAYDVMSFKKSTYFTGMLKFSESEVIFLSDISIDTPNILRLSSPIPGFRSGYYQIENSNFDYDYIHELIGNKTE